MSDAKLAISLGDVEFASEKSRLLQENQVSHDATIMNNRSIPKATPKHIDLHRRGRKKEAGLVALCCEWIVQHQVGLSVNLLLLLSLVYICFPKARRHTRKFVELSYQNPETNNYTAGWNDAFMVTFWVVVFTGLRAAVMDYVLQPFALTRGIRKKKDLVRFAEQGWPILYYAVFWPLGFYIMYTSDYWLNFKNLWVDWPTREIPGLRKWYIIVQYSFYLQQVLVVNIEKRRKDYWQMFFHHIVTCILIFTSYAYHQTKVANVILCLMDIVDIILPLAKCLKYLGYTTLCDITFGIFMVSWFISRHILFSLVCLSVWRDIPLTINYGCYEGKQGAMTGPFPPPDRFMHLIDPIRNPEGVVCFNHEIKWYFLSCLLFLQGLTLLWFWLIIQVAIKVIRGGSAEDNRSDDEEEVDEDEKETLEDFQPISDAKPSVAATAPLVPLEEEVGVEAINLKGRRSKKYRTGVSSSSGVTIPGHSDRKELLGRIGCDKGV